MLIDKLNNVEDKPAMTLSACSIQGGRDHMEDYFDIGYQMKPSDQIQPGKWPYEFFYIGVFDGHGGTGASSFAKKNLLKFITNQEEFWSDDDEDIMKAIRKGYSDTQAAMRLDMLKWERRGEYLPATAGTTASILFIKNGKFYSGHVGDSRITIVNEHDETKQWISEDITEDHKPESKRELLRIQRAGGAVRSKQGCHRVVWNKPVLRRYFPRPESNLDYDSDFDYKQYYLENIHHFPVPESFVSQYQIIPFLAVARSLGDFWSINPYTGQYVVSPEPDVYCRPIKDSDKGIILATDGFWNVLGSELAGRYLQELDIIKNERRQYHKNDVFLTDNFYNLTPELAGEGNFAESLVLYSYQTWQRKRLKSDNITVLVAMLHDVLHSSFIPEKTYLSPAITPLASEISDSIQLTTSKPKLVQIGKTDKFCEMISLNRSPKFLAGISREKYRLFWAQFAHFMLLPPTVVERANCPVMCPQNYVRLSEAKCTKFEFEDPSSSSSTDSWDYVYVKYATDDPSDEQELPTRLSKKGKEVKDASAQATQCLPDFGIPWKLMIGDYPEERPDSPNDFHLNLEELKRMFGIAEKCVPESFAAAFSNNGRYVGNRHDQNVDQSDEDTDDLVDQEDEDHDDQEDSSDSDDVDEDVDEDDHDEVGDEYADVDSDLPACFLHLLNSTDEDCETTEQQPDKIDSDKTTKLAASRSLTKPSERKLPATKLDLEISNPAKKVSGLKAPQPDSCSSIPQLRCLMNRTPPLRRSARQHAAAHQSVSENAKRKSSHITLEMSSKSKRRKSQPARCSEQLYP